MTTACLTNLQIRHGSSRTDERNIAAERYGFEYDDYDDLFLNGDAAFLVNGPWFVSKADASGIDYGIVNLPSFESGSNTYSIAGVRVMYVYSKAIIRKRRTSSHAIFSARICRGSE